MGTFIPIAMKCNQEQFNAVKPKLAKAGKIGHLIYAFDKYDYLTNNYGDEVNYFDFIDENRDSWDCRLNKIYHEWNEKIFLEACGIETETLQEKEQRLLKELEDVRKEIEDSKIKVGDFIYFNNGSTKGIDKVINIDSSSHYQYSTQFCLYKQSEVKKITNPELIKLLEKYIK